MSQLKRYIALDLGGSARCVVGAFDGETLSLEVIRRFKNPYVHALDQVYLVKSGTVCNKSSPNMAHRL